MITTPFPVEERVVLILADGKDKKVPGELRLVTVEDPERIGDSQDWMQGSEVYAPHQEPQKWETEFQDSAASVLDRLSASELLVPLRSIGKASIGYVTGANDYFVLTKSEVQARGLPARVLKPTVLAARHVLGASFTRADLNDLVRLNQRCFLWTGTGARLRRVADYIEHGRSQGVPHRYKCRVRKPWYVYVVPGVVAPDAFLTYMSDLIPRLILNSARAACSNTLLAIRLDAVDRHFQSAFVAAFYTSATMLSAERTGRRYGGGVLKLEPSEADRVLVASPKFCERFEAAGLSLNRVDALLRSRSIPRLLAEVDEVVLERILGLNTDEIETIQRSLERRQATRKRKPRISRATATQQTCSD